VWRDPKTRFVAQFLGHENVLDAATVAALGLGDGRHAVVVPDAAITLTETGPYQAVVADVRFRGATSRVVLHLVRPGADAVELVWNAPIVPAKGRRVGLAIDRALLAELTEP